MEEKPIESKENAIIAKKVTDITQIGKAVFFIFFNIFKPADKIKKITQTWIPRKADATQVTDKKRSKNREIRKMTVKEGITIPSVETTAPAVFPF